MTKYLLFVLALALSLVNASCSKDVLRGHGPIRTEIRNVANFEAVETAGTTAIRINYGNSQELQVSGYANLLPYLETSVNNGVLTVGFSRQSLIQNDNTEVTITLPRINAIRNAGTSSIRVNGAFQSNALDLRLSGTGELRIDGMQAGRVRLVNSGTSHIKAFGLSAEDAEITQSGTGNTEITALRSLKVNLTGTGSVYYKGNPSLDLRIQGTGNVVKR